MRNDRDGVRKRGCYWLFWGLNKLKTNIMGLIIGLGILGFFLGVGFLIMDYHQNREVVDSSNWFYSLFISLFLTAAGMNLGFIISIFIPFQYEKELDKTIYIHNIQDNQSVSGSMSLGIGSIDGTMKYTFYCESNGFIELKQVSHYRAKIKYTNGKPKVNVFKYVGNGSKINYFALPDNRPPTKYVIYIPKGTIEHNYNLDAE